MLTTVLELFAVALIVAGAVAVVIGVSGFSIPAAWLVGGFEVAALGFGALWVSKRVTR